MKQEARFITKPKLKYEYTDSNGFKFYSLKHDLIFWTGKEQIVSKAVDENGVFISNLASIPKPLWFILKPNKHYYLYSSIQHDSMYSNKAIYSRLYADKIYNLAMKSEGTPFYIRWTFFLLIRLFGSSYR